MTIFLDYLFSYRCRFRYKSHKYRYKHRIVHVSDPLYTHSPIKPYTQLCLHLLKMSIYNLRPHS
jgi:hypothetical protein